MSERSFDYIDIVDPTPPAKASTLPSEEQVRAAVTAFSMLAEPTRLRLLWLLAAEELDVSTLASRVGGNASAVSQHLGRLRLAGLVDTRKEGRRVLYRARDRHVRTVIAETVSHVSHELQGVERVD